MVNHKIKKIFAFTLAETILCLAILGVIVAMTMNVFTKKHKKIIYNPTHGFYMCYMDNKGVVQQKLGTQNAQKMSSGTCVFNAKKVANYFVVYAVGGGGGGGSDLGGNPGEFTSVFVTSIADQLRITPGAAGGVNENGGETVISNGHGEEITKVDGGFANGIYAVKKENVKSCESVPMEGVLDIEQYKYRSNEKPSCSVDKDQLTVKVCSNGETINQHEYIQKFFQDMKDDYKILKGLSDTGDNYQTAMRILRSWSYNVGRNWLYHLLVVHDDESIYTISQHGGIWDGENWEGQQAHYVADEHKIYYHDRLEEDDSLIYYLAGLTKDSKYKEACLTNKLGYDEVVLNETDKGNVISRPIKNGTKNLYNVFITLTRSIGTVVNKTVNELESDFGRTIEASGLKNKDTEVLLKSGAGGAKNKAGYAGAVIIVW